MGRLFWKFFFFIWLAQACAIVGVGAVFAWERAQYAPRWEAPHPSAGDAPHPDFPRDGATRLADRPPPPPRDGARFGLPPRGLHVPVEPLVASLLASLVFAALLARHFSRPIRTLRSAFDAAAAGQLDVRVAAAMGGRHDELADLGRDFDRMVAILQTLVGNQRRLLHDVSHELRSPLARMQIAMGLIRQQPDKIDACVDRMEKESVRMDLLIDELLTLSRLEAGMLEVRRDPIDVVELLAAIVEDARFEAEGRQVAIALSGNENAVVEGNAELLHRAVENVVRNAVKCTLPGSHVSIAVRASPRDVEIAVDDAGPGVFEHDLEAIFSPFRRGSQRSDIHGYGLGLAISKRVVESMHGRIEGVNLPGGFRMRMTLPARQPTTA